jgi:pimeloyl-ACP methyl ester carboxylesterase
MHWLTGAVFLIAGSALYAADFPQRFMVDRGNVHIEVLAQGKGPVLLILPSRGRGAEDYDQVAPLIAGKGFRVLRPQPRGIGKSTGPLAGLTLHDYAADVAAVIENESKVPVVVVGHAFGNYVARVLATDRPELVKAVVLAAASPGKAPKGSTEDPIAPEIRQAIDRSGELEIPEAERLKYVQLAFFAPGHDARVWLNGWYPEAMKSQAAATTATPVQGWFACGRAPILDLQAENDTVAPRKFAGVLKDELGDRVTVKVIAHAGHALAPEQPRAMAQAIVEFAARL